MRWKSPKDVLFNTFDVSDSVSRASAILYYGIQSQNVSTRSEVTQWFSVAILYNLQSAQLLTSGTENDWGFGILEFPYAS